MLVKLGTRPARIPSTSTPLKDNKSQKSHFRIPRYGPARIVATNFPHSVTVDRSYGRRRLFAECRFITPNFFGEVLALIGQICNHLGGRNRHPAVGGVPGGWSTGGYSPFPSPVAPARNGIIGKRKYAIYAYSG